jgi:hypothetical protein
MIVRCVGRKWRWHDRQDDRRHEWPHDAIAGACAGAVTGGPGPGAWSVYPSAAGQRGTAGPVYPSAVQSEVGCTWQRGSRSVHLSAQKGLEAH